MSAPELAFDATFAATAATLIHPNADGTPFTPLDAQRHLARLLATRQRVIALQPTGSGKTLAATLPFAANLLAPAQMIFMTPMRSLTSAQTRTISSRFNAASVLASLGIRVGPMASPGAWSGYPRACMSATRNLPIKR